MSRRISATVGVGVRPERLAQPVHPRGELGDLHRRRRNARPCPLLALGRGLPGILGGLELLLGDPVPRRRGGGRVLEGSAHRARLPRDQLRGQGAGAASASSASASPARPARPARSVCRGRRAPLPAPGQLPRPRRQFGAVAGRQTPGPARLSAAPAPAPRATPGRRPRPAARAALPRWRRGAPPRSLRTGPPRRPRAGSLARASSAAAFTRTAPSSSFTRGRSSSSRRISAMFPS